MGKRSLRLIVLAGSTVSLLASAASAACDAGVVALRGDWGEARFRIELADDPDERAEGLMHREDLAAGRGMLFLYEQPQPASFWMRNTLIPLDMIFMDRTGTVVSIHENARPMDETPIFGGDEILAVLEINGGMASQIGIAPGTELRHPDLPQNAAAWPCDGE